MNAYQFRAIRNSFQRDVIFCKGTAYNNNLIDYPLMRKKIEDVIVKGKKPKHIFLQYTLTKGANVYKLYIIAYGHTSSDMAVITKNDRIIYWTTSPISAPYWAAWYHITEVYHGYGDGDRSSSWTWISVDDFDCQECGTVAEQLTKEWNEPWYKRLHTPYQERMFANTGKLYIDKKIVSQDIIDEKAKGEYYHT